MKLKDVDMFRRIHRLAVSENIDIEEDALRLITFRAEGSLRDAENTLEQFNLLPAKVTLTIVLQTKLKDVDMFSRLHRLAVSENIDIEEDALRLITFRAEGLLRDDENTLERFNLLPAKVTLTIVLQTIGLIPHEKLVELLDFALVADTENTVRTTQEIIDSGIQPLTLVSQLATLITDILASGCIPALKNIVELKPATENQLPGMADAAKGIGRKSASTSRHFQARRRHGGCSKRENR